MEETIRTQATLEQVLARQDALENVMLRIESKLDSMWEGAMGGEKWNKPEDQSWLKNLPMKTWMSYLQFQYCRKKGKLWCVYSYCCFYIIRISVP